MANDKGMRGSPGDHDRTHQATGGAARAKAERAKGPSCPPSREGMKGTELDAPWPLPDDEY